jgi:predicted SnoaL-like aldol condensation-catalyzing enzyme
VKLVAEGTAGSAGKKIQAAGFFLFQQQPSIRVRLLCDVMEGSFVTMLGHATWYLPGTT